MALEDELEWLGWVDMHFCLMLLGSKRNHNLRNIRWELVESKELSWFWLLTKVVPLPNMETTNEIKRCDVARDLFHVFVSETKHLETGKNGRNKNE